VRSTHGSSRSADGVVEDLLDLKKSAHDAPQWSVNG
jgi:hypothetical protein